MLQSNPSENSDGGMIVDDFNSGTMYSLSNASDIDPVLSRKNSTL